MWTRSLLMEVYYLFNKQFRRVGCVFVKLGEYPKDIVFHQTNENFIGIFRFNSSFHPIATNTYLAL